MALHSMFTPFLVINLSLYFSHGVFSDKTFRPHGGLLGGLNSSRGKHNEKKSQIGKEAEVPRFLLHLYRKRTHLPRGRLSGRDSDIVRVFLREPLGKDQQDGPLNHLLIFNLSAIASNENVKRAELRIYKKKSMKHGNNTGGNLKIRVFPLKMAQNKRHHPQRYKAFLASHVISLRENVGRWIAFDVTSAIQFWKQNPGETDFGLRLAVQGMKAFPTEFRIDSRGKRAPFLVTYTYNPPIKSFRSSKALQNCSNTQALEGDDLLHNNSSTPRRRGRRSAGHKECRRRWVYVQFKKLRWNWIIAPSGYSANYCEGACSSVLHIALEPTNHAILQNILHRMDNRIPSPSCVPTKLHGISILYRASDRSIALTEYGGMVVSTCGCH
ncbi:PREDICTED: bone morphogenetic protein 8A-like isoform X1 [Acropora digitifera]|uniref:Transforming growth factor 3 protein n=1 Tax=Acropora digitifera TaxID=70779 RepID=A0A0A8K7M1_ACRDI|nr:PREDICTED: bone morphogenetic protein 8A-like isoform X1 [Acropora digitifera]BAQ19092.1 transforming growth factor 3 protein [Acropora digitifera]